jgi:Uma2 family endonuclease
VDPRPAWPEVDDHILANGCLFELVDGELIPVVPADEPHSAAHRDLVALLSSHAAQGFRVGVDLLTRVAERSEVAPDACVYPEGRDEGHRRLEELAFEVLATEHRTHAARKAQLLIARGVRRVFAIDLVYSQVLEWEPGSNRWRSMVPGSVIEDRCLVRPLSTDALRGAAQASHEEMEAWLTKEHPVLTRELHKSKAAGRLEGKVEGKAEGLRMAIEDACELLGMELTPEQREHLAGLDLAGLQRLRAHLKSLKRWP